MLHISTTSDLRGRKAGSELPDQTGSRSQRTLAQPRQLHGQRMYTARPREKTQAPLLREIKADLGDTAHGVRPQELKSTRGEVKLNQDKALMATFCFSSQRAVVFIPRFTLAILPGSSISRRLLLAWSLPFLPAQPGDLFVVLPLPSTWPVLHSFVKTFLSFQDSIPHVPSGHPEWCDCHHTLYTRTDAVSHLPVGYSGISPEHWWVCYLNLRG